VAMKTTYGRGIVNI